MWRAHDERKSPYRDALDIPEQITGVLRSQRFSVLLGASPREVRLAAALGLPGKGIPKLVVREWIENTVKLALGTFRELAATEKQILLATHCGMDLAGVTRAVASPVCAAVLRVLSTEAVRRMALSEGMRVSAPSFGTWPDPDDHARDVFEISSVGADGKVYFRSGRSGQAWACMVERV